MLDLQQGIRLDGGNQGGIYQSLRVGGGGVSSVKSPFVTIVGGYLG